MSLAILLEDALTRTPAGFVVRVSLPWIRSLPLWSVADLTLQIDGVAMADISVILDDARVDPAQLQTRDEWWFIQDRLVIEATADADPGAHEVHVAFTLTVPYLPGGPDRPLVLPFEAGRRLDTDAITAAPAASRAVG